MDSPSDTRDPAGAPVRPSAELLTALRDGKAALRQRRIHLPLLEKVRQMLALQRLQHPLLAARRPLRSWEKPWLRAGTSAGWWRTRRPATSARRWTTAA